MSEQPPSPSMHPDAPPLKVADEKSGGYVPAPEGSDPKGDLEALAAISAMTQSATGEINESIVGDAGSQLRPNAFDAKATLMKHIANNPGSAPAGATQVPPPQYVQQPAQQPLPQQGWVQPAPPTVVPSLDEGQILRRLLAIEDRLDRLSEMGDKVLKSLLKKNTKQVTIRFDDSQNSKSK